MPASPAGREMRCRTTGSSRPRKVDISPWPEEKGFNPGEFFLGDPDVFAVFQEQRPAEMTGSKIIDVGTHQAAQGSAEDRKTDIHLPLLGEIAGRRHHQFAGNRNNGTFHGHEQKDAGVAHGANGGDEPINELRAQVALVAEWNIKPGILAGLPGKGHNKPLPAVRYSPQLQKSTAFEVKYSEFSGTTT